MKKVFNLFQIFHPLLLFPFKNGCVVGKNLGCTNFNGSFITWLSSINSTLVALWWRRSQLVTHCLGRSLISSYLEIYLGTCARTGMYVEFVEIVRVSFVSGMARSRVWFKILCTIWSQSFATTDPWVCGAPIIWSFRVLSSSGQRVPYLSLRIE